MLWGCQCKFVFTCVYFIRANLYIFSNIWHLFIFLGLQSCPSLLNCLLGFKDIFFLFSSLFKILDSLFWSYLLLSYLPLPLPTQLCIILKTKKKLSNTVFAAWVLLCGICGIALLTANWPSLPQQLSVTRRCLPRGGTSCLPSLSKPGCGLALVYAGLVGAIVAIVSLGSHSFLIVIFLCCLFSLCFLPQ